MPPPHLLYTKPPAQLLLSPFSLLPPSLVSFPCCTYLVLFLARLWLSFVSSLCRAPSTFLLLIAFFFPCLSCSLFTSLSTSLHSAELCNHVACITLNWIDTKIVININTDITFTSNDRTLAWFMSLQKDFNLYRNEENPGLQTEK